MIEINHRLLDKGTLDNLLAEIILREGTDYGDSEVTFADKKKQLRHLLDSGQAAIIHHASDGFCEMIKITQ